MKNETLRIKRRCEDGHRTITARIKEGALAKLDSIAADSNYSRNELINIILEHGVEIISKQSKSEKAESPQEAC